MARRVPPLPARARARTDAIRAATATLALISLVRVAGALVRRETFGAESTIALGLLVLAARALLRRGSPT